MYQRTMTGPVREEVAAMPDLKARELWAVGPLIALIVVLGVYPRPILDIINPAVHSTLVGTHSTDPVPAHPATVSNTTAAHHGRHSADRTALVSRVPTHPAPHKQGSSA
jgi:hypothetical protein